MLYALTAILTLLAAALLVWTCYRSGTTRMLTLWPGLLYVAITIACPFAYAAWQGQLAAILLILITAQLASAPPFQEDAKGSYTSTLLLLVGSLFCPGLCLFIPLVWWAFIYRQTFSHRVFLASLLAIATFAIWYGVFLYLTQMPSRLSIPQFTLPAVPLWQLGIFITILLVGIYLLGAVFWRFGRISRRRRFMTLLHLLYLAEATMLFFTTDGICHLPICTYSFCIIAILYKRRND